MIGGGAIAGIGFTVSLLIASLAFHGVELEEAKLGVLTAALGASLATWLVFRLTKLLPKPTRLRAFVGTAETLVDLAEPVDRERDHIRGRLDAPLTLVEYGDYECPYCGQAEAVVRELLRTSATSATSGATCRSTMSIPMRSSPRRPRRRRGRRASSGRCTTCCSPIRTR